MSLALKIIALFHQITTTWNPGDKAAEFTLSNGNLTASRPSSGAGFANVRATVGRSTGKWYFEIAVVTDATGQTFVGISTSSVGLNVDPGDYADAVVATYGGTIETAGAQTGTGATFLGGDNVGVAVDLDTGDFQYRVNGGSWGVGTFTPGAGLYFPIVTGGNNNIVTVTANFGATAFAYSIPVGYRAWGA